MKLFAKIKNIIVTRKSFFRNKISFTLLIIALFLNLISWIYIFVYIKPQDEPIFLHYNIYYGVDLIGEWFQIYFYAPLMGIIICFVNSFISYILYKRDIRLTYLIEGINIFLQLSVLVAIYLIIQQNL